MLNNEAIFNATIITNLPIQIKGSNLTKNKMNVKYCFYEQETIDLSHHKQNLKGFPNFCIISIYHHFELFQYLAKFSLPKFSINHYAIDYLALK